MGDVTVSVVIPVYNGASTLGRCLAALCAQSLSQDGFEVIVVDDGSTDRTASIARDFGVRVIAQANRGAPAARNAGITAARGRWVAFTDSDCVPSRQWLQQLLRSVADRPNAIGVAGKTVGFGSHSRAARFVDLIGGLDAARTLVHPTYPFAPTANVMYRAECLKRAGGFDERFATYDACDLHTRLLAFYPGQSFTYEASAIVLHGHRDTWRSYWRQQYGYGVGYAQFLLAHRVGWSALRELREIAGAIGTLLAALWPGKSDRAVARHGFAVRRAAQHVGFCRTYYDRRERARW